MDRPPIFIVGSPRSGTSLMRRILDRHPLLAICGETHFLPTVYGRRQFFGDLADEANRKRVIREYLATGYIDRAGINTPELAERLLREATSYKTMFTTILTYNAELRGKQRFGEKTPRHALFVDTLCDWFPNAVVIHMMRDPRAVVASLQRAKWAPSSVVINARRWLALNQAARRFHKWPGYLEVRYEELVTNPVSELGKICSFLGEEYSPSMLVPEENLAGDSVPRWRTAVTSTGLERWRKELTAREIAQIEWAVSTNFESFGYARESSSPSTFTVLRGLGYAGFVHARTEITRLKASWSRGGTPVKIGKRGWQGP